MSLSNLKSSMVDVNAKSLNVEGNSTFLGNLVGDVSGNVKVSGNLVASGFVTPSVFSAPANSGALGNAVGYFTITGSPQAIDVDGLTVNSWVDVCLVGGTSAAFTAGIVGNAILSANTAGKLNVNAGGGAGPAPTVGAQYRYVAYFR